MLTTYRRALIQSAVGGAFCLLFAAAVFANTGQDTWYGLFALFASACGIALLFNAIRLWVQKIGERSARQDNERTVQQGCILAFLRFLLILIMILAAGCWLWFSLSDLNDLRLLISGPVIAQATVIGNELVRPEAAIGYVHYSYRVTGTLAPEDRFAVPHSQYTRYYTGQQFPVTYSASDPRVHRIGQVDWSYVVRRLLYWCLVFVNSAGFLLLPLWVLEYYRRPPDSSGSSLAKPA
jgi:hypothetical protein